MRSRGISARRATSLDIIEFFRLHPIRQDGPIDQAYISYLLAAKLIKSILEGGGEGELCTTETCKSIRRVVTTVDPDCRGKWDAKKFPMSLLPVVLNRLCQVNITESDFQHACDVASQRYGGGTSSLNALSPGSFTTDAIVIAPADISCVATAAHHDSTLALRESLSCMNRGELVEEALETHIALREAQETIAALKRAVRSEKRRRLDTHTCMVQARNLVIEYDKAVCYRDGARAVSEYGKYSMAILRSVGFVSAQVAVHMLGGSILQGELKHKGLIVGAEFRVAAAMRLFCSEHQASNAAFQGAFSIVNDDTTPAAGNSDHSQPHACVVTSLSVVMFKSDATNSKACEDNKVLLAKSETLHCSQGAYEGVVSSPVENPFPLETFGSFLQHHFIFLPMQNVEAGTSEELFRNYRKQSACAGISTVEDRANQWEAAIGEQSGPYIVLGPANLFSFAFDKGAALVP